MPASNENAAAAASPASDRIKTFKNKGRGDNEVRKGKGGVTGRNGIGKKKKPGVINLRARCGLIAVVTNIAGTPPPPQ